MGTEITVRLDWSQGKDVHARPVNVVLVQGIGEEVVVSLGHAPPPVETASLNGDDLTKYFKKAPMSVQQIARFTLAAGMAGTLAKRLEEVLQNRPAAAAPATFTEGEL